MTLLSVSSVKNHRAPRPEESSPTGISLRVERVTAFRLPDILRLHVNSVNLLWFPAQLLAPHGLFVIAHQSATAALLSVLFLFAAGVIASSCRILSYIACLGDGLNGALNWSG